MAEVYNYNELTCLITIGDFDPTYPSLIKASYAFSEVVDIDIVDSFKNFTNTAKVTLPRDIILSLGEKDSTGEREERALSDAGSVFTRGQRITISVGYDDLNKKLFDGFIVSIEAKSPFVLHCEDFGWKLKKTAISPITTSKTGTLLNDLVPKLLDGTGIDLHPYTKAMDIKIGQVILEKSKSIGEILEQWKRNYGLLSFIKFYDGKPYLALSRTYFSTNNDQTLIDGESDNPPIANFQDNVAFDNLKFSYLDHDTLALEAISLFPDNSRLRMTIITNKDYATQKAKYDIGETSVAPDEFEIVNESKISKKQAKNNFKSSLQIKDNIANVKNIQDKFDMAQYNVRTYHEFNVDRDTLAKNAKAKFKEISQTGISGDLTLFGDFGLRAASMIRLYDARNPEKNGLYVISEVKTKFGIGGYRQTIQIPYKRGN